MRGFFYILLCSLVIGACTTDKETQQEGVVVAHIATNPRSLHITNGADQVRNKVFALTQRTLYQMDIRTQEYIPVLLKVMPLSDEDGVYEFHLREDVTWDDGSQLTAEDVIFSTKVAMCPLTNNPGFRGMFTFVIDSLAADPDDPYHFSFIAKGPNILNNSIFSELPIFQKSFWDPEGATDDLHFADFSDPEFKASKEVESWFEGFNDEKNGRDLDRLTGLGPYKVTEWEQDAQLVVERKEDWWGSDDTLIYQQAIPKKIIFRVVQSDQNTVLDLKKEKLDVSDRLGTTDLIELRQDDDFNKNYHSDFVPMFGYMYIGLNCRPDGVEHKPIFSDTLVRHAFAHCVPVDEMIETILHGKGHRQAANVSPSKDYYNEGLQPIQLDPDHAADLLQAAGWIDSDGDNIRDKMINGEKVDLKVKVAYLSVVDDYKTMLLMVKDAAYKAGMEVILDPMDMNRWQEVALSQDFDAIMGSWVGSAGYQDPSQLWHTSSWENHGMNFCGFGNAKTDSIIQNTVSTDDPEHYSRGMKLLQKEIYNAQPYVFLYQPTTKVVVHKRFNRPGMYPEKPNIILNALELKEE